MNLKKLPPEEKPRERLLKYGKNGGGSSSYERTGILWR